MCSSSQSQPSSVEPVRGFARPLNLISNPKEKFFYTYAPLSSHPASQKFCVNAMENLEHNLPFPMPNTDIPLSFVKDFTYQTSTISTQSSRSASNLYLISMCKDRVLYHPIQTKLLLRSRRGFLGGASKQDLLPADPSSTGIILRRRDFSSHEQAFRRERSSELLPKGANNAITEEGFYEE